VRLDVFAAAGVDLVDGAAAAGWEPELLLRAGEDVERDLLDEVSTLGSGTRVIGVYRRRWSEPGGRLSAYLHAVDYPGNVGTILRAAHGLCDGPVMLGPGCADPYSPKAVRASMGSLFARPPARAEPQGTLVALDPRAEVSIADVVVEAPVVVCLGAEREGLPAELLERASIRARIPLREDGPESLNVGMAATVALYELANRMAAHA
jgi:TrmH family RNA methyltransferase